jgi:O-antigen/teichoic acid export membrane protein
MSLERSLRDLFRHSAVYASAYVVTRLVSVALLPVYSRHVAPEEYAVLALLDLSAGILGTLIGGGIASALVRFHFEDEDDERRKGLWLTGLAFVAVLSIVTIAPLLVLRDPLARVLFGPEVARGGLYLALGLAQVGFEVVGAIVQAYLRVRKWSGWFVAAGLLRLALNVTVNLVLLLGFGWGVVAILIGNVIAAAAFATLPLAIGLSLARPLVFRPSVVPELWRFGRPLVLASLLATVFQSGDRYLMRPFVAFEAIGLYAMTATIVHGVHAMIAMPFATIWNVSIFEIGAEADARRSFAAIFRGYFDVLVSVSLAIALCVPPLIVLLLDARYHAGVGLVPVLALGAVFAGLHEQLRVPSLLAKRTDLVPPVFARAIAARGLAGLVLIPVLGAHGAAFAALAGSVALAAAGWNVNRKVDAYPYPLARCARVLGGAVVAASGFEAVIASAEVSPLARVATGAALTVAFAAAVFRNEISLLTPRTERRRGI